MGTIAEAEECDHGVSSIAAINRHRVFINDQITKTFNGEKTIAIDIEK